MSYLRGLTCHPCESRYLDSRLRGNDILQLLRHLRFLANRQSNTKIGLAI
ncbi:hypothetical protein [Candidatus Tisiphia endosymbiont of Hybos culiciformis]